MKRDPIVYSTDVGDGLIRLVMGTGVDYVDMSFVLHEYSHTASERREPPGKVLTTLRVDGHDLFPPERLLAMALQRNEITGQSATDAAHYLFWEIIIMRDPDLDFLKLAHEARAWAAMTRLGVNVARRGGENYSFDATEAIRRAAREMNVEQKLAFERQILADGSKFLDALEAAVEASHGDEFLTRQLAA